MPFGIYISNVTCTAYAHNIMSVSSPLYCFQVQVGPVITKGECTVGGCSDWSMSGCSLLTLQMDLEWEWQSDFQKLAQVLGFSKDFFDNHYVLIGLHWLLCFILCTLNFPNFVLSKNCK